MSLVESSVEVSDGVYPMVLSSRRPPEFPTDRYKSWKRELSITWSPPVVSLSSYSSGLSLARIKKALSMNDGSIFEAVKPALVELNLQSRAHDVEGTIFTIESSTSYDEYWLTVTATGYRLKTEKERARGSKTAITKADAKKLADRERREKKERAQLARLQLKYPI